MFMLMLHLYNSGDNFMRRRGYAVEYCAEYLDGYWDPAGCRARADTIYTPFASFQDIEAELRRIGGLGGKVDILLIHSHGAPGMIFVRTGLLAMQPCIDVSNVHLLAQVCRLALPANGRVFFAGCNVGYGPSGAAFLRAAGKHMLGHGGGVILAVTSVTFSVPGFLGQRIPAWGSIRAAKVSPDGTVAISEI
jgi:hypothetical protein